MQGETDERTTQNLCGMWSGTGGRRGARPVSALSAASRHGQPNRPECDRRRRGGGGHADARCRMSANRSAPIASCVCWAGAAWAWSTKPKSRRRAGALRSRCSAGSSIRPKTGADFSARDDWPPRSTIRTAFTFSAPRKSTARRPSPWNSSPAARSQERVKNRGPMPVPVAVDAILQIIAGLEAAQAIGILHRDIKPGNCFEDADGTIKIGDFGLSISTAARAETNITADGRDGGNARVLLARTTPRRGTECPVRHVFGRRNAVLSC